MSSLQSIVVLILCGLTFFGSAYALDCIMCSWEATKQMGDEKCMGYPFQTQIEYCGENPGGLTYICQTHTMFMNIGQSKHLTSLTRRCALEHEHCNKPCFPNSTQCWLCCSNGNKCNSYPLTASVLISNLTGYNINQANVINYYQNLIGLILPIGIALISALVLS